MLLFFTFYSSKNSVKEKCVSFHKNKQHSCFQQIIIINVSWAANQHARMSSEGSCDTENWRNDAENLLHEHNILIWKILPIPNLNNSVCVSLTIMIY